MFGLPVLWLVAAGVVAAALAGSHWRVYEAGKGSVQHEWDIAKAELAAAQATADEVQRLKGHAAALSYEQGRTVRMVRAEARTKEASDAIDTDVRWRDEPLPDRLRDSLAAARAAFAASQPDRALQLPVAGDPEQRAVGTGLRLGPRRAGGVLGAASSVD